jgi:cellulose synthase/poly-beta-1,6-N-acetylglucosamine synthase-like glycosyltransferase
MIELAFWGLIACIAWSLAGYGLTWILLARIAGLFERPSPSAVVPLRVTMLIAARNEAASIRDKLESVLRQDVGPHSLDVLVVSDGSTDDTLDQARSVQDPRVQAFETAAHGGKAQALAAGLARIESDVVVFSDANSILVPGAMRALLEPFRDREVGGVCGHPAIRRDRGGWLAGAERLFWAYDSALKAAEHRLAGVVSAQGTLYAMRRPLVPDSIPADVADDLWISLNAPNRGYRLAFAPGAQAQEIVTDLAQGEFMRRVRSTERGWRGLMNFAGLMNPWRTGLYAVQLIGHKLLRRLTAFLLPAAFVLSLALIPQHPLYLGFALLQVAALAVAVATVVAPGMRRIPGTSALVVFVMGHLAMALGILRAMAGHRTHRWSPVRESVQ